MDCNKKEVVIAVMGPTGSGKTTFINMAARSDLPVGDELKSCTSTVQTAPDFELDGRKVTLIDTPGFDDTSMTDTQILRMIALFLSETYQNGIKLAGVLYFHRISDNRMGGISIRNFKMFRDLCGEKSLKNVAIVTNMWGQIRDEVGLAREKELMSDDMFFKLALDKQAQMQRHDNTVDSAHNIIRKILKNHPVPLQIQEELVDEGKDLSATTAGETLGKELRELAEMHRRQIEMLKAEMRQALATKDEEYRQELEEERQNYQGEMERVLRAAGTMAALYKADKERWEKEKRMVVVALLRPLLEGVTEVGKQAAPSLGWMQRFLMAFADFMARTIVKRPNPSRRRLNSARVTERDQDVY